MIRRIKNIFLEGADLRIAVSESMSEDIIKAVELCLNSIREGGKILLMGNGGSAADAQHIAGELVGRFLKERRAIAAISLSTDTTILTAIGNDYGYEKIFVRQIEALAKKGDIAFGISTSGNSKNICLGLKLAKEMGLKTIGLTGCGGGAMKDLCDLPLVVPSNSTPRVQEIHIAIGHIICEEIEKGIL